MKENDDLKNYHKKGFALLVYYQPHEQMPPYLSQRYRTITNVFNTSENLTYQICLLIFTSNLNPKVKEIFTKCLPKCINAINAQK